MRDYWHCIVCNENNDFGEPCSCQKVEQEQPEVALPFVTVPNDYGTHDKSLYEEVGQNGKVL